MITPAYSLTATERVLPRLALDFTTGVLDPRVTVTRALNTATRVNSSGLVEVVNANLPRFDYNPVTLAPRGLLIEEARTNLLLRSEEFDNAAWVKYAGTTITPNAAISPDGSSTADLMYPATSGTNRGVYQAFTGGNLTYTQSIYVKSAGKNFVAFYDFEGATYAGSVDLTTGSTASVKAGYTITPTQAGSGWWRIAVTATTTTGTRYLTMIVVDAASSASVTASGTNGVFVWGGQTEAGAFATSYIPTTTTSVTRNADVATMTGTNFSDWYQAGDSTFAASGSFLALGSNAIPYRNALMGISDGTVANSFAFGKSVSGFPADTPAAFSTNGNFTATIPSALITSVNEVVTMVMGLQNNNCVLAAKAVLSSVDTSSSTLAVNELRIGGRSGSSVTDAMNGHVRSIRYWPLRLLNAENQAFSKG